MPRKLTPTSIATAVIVDPAVGIIDVFHGTEEETNAFLDLVADRQDAGLAPYADARAYLTSTVRFSA